MYFLSELPWVDCVLCYEVFCGGCDPGIEAGDCRQWSEGYLHPTRFDLSAYSLVSDYGEAFGLCVARLPRLGSFSNDHGDDSENFTMK